MHAWWPQMQLCDAIAVCCLDLHADMPIHVHADVKSGRPQMHTHGALAACCPALLIKLSSQSHQSKLAADNCCA